MHQSPMKHPVARRDKHGWLDAADDTDGEAERRLHRASQPKARKHALRDDDSPPRSGSMQQRGAKGPR